MFTSCTDFVYAMVAIPLSGTNNIGKEFNFTLEIIDTKMLVMINDCSISCK